MIDFNHYGVERITRFSEGASKNFQISFAVEVLS
jgi:hypothetical protein